MAQLPPLASRGGGGGVRVVKSPPRTQFVQSSSVAAASAGARRDGPDGERDEVGRLLECAGVPRPRADALAAALGLEGVGDCAAVVAGGAEAFRAAGGPWASPVEAFRAYAALAAIAREADALPPRPGARARECAGAALLRARGIVECGPEMPPNAPAYAAEARELLFPAYAAGPEKGDFNSSVWRSYASKRASKLREPEER